METLASKLIEIAKSIEPRKGYFGYLDLVDNLEAKPRAMAQFKALLKNIKPEELDGLEDADEKYGWIVAGAIDALDLAPDDPRLFLSEHDIATMPDGTVLDALCSACIVNDINAVRTLSKRTDVNLLDHNQQCALAYAVGNNHLECVRALLAAGADPNLVQNWGDTPLHDCATTVSSKDILQALIAAGGNVSLRNDKDQTVIDLLEEYGRRDWLT